MTENQCNTLESLLEALSCVLRTGTARQYAELRDYYDRLATHFNNEGTNETNF